MEREEATYGDKTPSIYDSPRCCSDFSMVFPAMADSSFVVPDFNGPDCPNAESPGLLASWGQSDQPAQTAAAALAQTPSPNVVLVQVPVEVPCGANSPLGHGPFNASVTILSQEADAATGAVSLEMRLVLGPSGKGAKCPSSTFTPPSRRLQRHSSKSDVPPRVRACPGAIAAEKQDLECCHWKAKGWCKYEDKCKFMHLKQKRGIAHGGVDKTADGCADNVVKGAAENVIAAEAADAAAKLQAQPTPKRSGIRSKRHTASQTRARLQAQ